MTTVQRIKTTSFRIATLTLIAVFCVASFPVQPAKALNDCDKEVLDNSINYFNCYYEEGCGTPTVLGFGTVPSGWTAPKSDIAKINKNMPTYQKVSKETGIPALVFAAIHYRESSLSLKWNSNKQGIYQFPTNAVFPASGTATIKEFEEQTRLAAEELLGKMDTVADLMQKAGTKPPSFNKNNKSSVTAAFNTPDFLKGMFFAYNGWAGVYANQATQLGYANKPWEGSPYVMNLWDDPRNGSKATDPQKWGQIKRDYGPIEYPATDQVGAFTIYVAIGGGNPTAGQVDSKTERAKYIWNELRTQGLSAIAAAGILGNLEAESGINPTSKNPSSGAYGFAQWLNDRYNNLLKFADKPEYKDKGLTYKDTAVQTDFLWHELSDKDQRFYKNVTEVLEKKNLKLLEATTVVYNYYEGLIGSGQGSISERNGFAKKWLAKFGSLPVEPNSASPAPTEGSTADCGGTTTGPGQIPQGSSAQLILSLLEKHYKGTLNGHKYNGDGKLTCQGGKCAELDNSARGKGIGGYCSVKAFAPEIIQYLLVVIGQGGFDIEISSLCATHPVNVSGTGRRSAHNVGRAIDISSVNKKWISGTCSSEPELSALMKYNISMIGSKLVPRQSLAQGVCYQYRAAIDNLTMSGGKKAPGFTKKYVGDHMDHLHVGF